DLLFGAYVYLEPFRVTSVQPNFGPTAGGTAVVIKGTGFAVDNDVQVWFGAAPATGVQVLDSTSIRVTTPNGLLGPVDVVVKNDASKSNSATVTLAAGFLYAQRDDVTLATGLTVQDWAIEPASNLAFVIGTSAAEGSVLKVVNLTVDGEDLSQRVGLNQTIATLKLPQEANGAIAILPERDLVFVSTKTDLIVIDAGGLDFESNPANELVVLATRSLDSTQGGGIAAAGNTVYVAAGDAGVRVFNTHFPDRPFLMDTIDTRDAGLDVDIIGSSALVVREGVFAAPIAQRRYPYANGQVQRHSGSAEIFDIISSEHEPLSRIEIDFERMKAGGDALYFVSQLDGLAKYDVRHLRAPVLLGKLGGLGRLNDFDLRFALGFAAVGNTGMQYLDLSPPNFADGSVLARATNPTFDRELLQVYQSFGVVYGLFANGEIQVLATRQMSPHSVFPEPSSLVEAGLDQIKAVFISELAGASVTTANVRIVDETAETSVAFTDFDLIVEGNTILLNLQSPLAPGHAYRVEIDRSIKDIFGLSPLADLVWRFRTATQAAAIRPEITEIYPGFAPTSGGT
ncbi:MAG TPA: IPT/TIG domain-containing protein, partial [Opitutus sp.]|nr:IPT/TIG domain-containing protein [Opitutus sp.]